MSARTPWWYSGDEDETTEIVEVAGAESVAEEAEDASTSTGGGPRDWLALVAGAQRVVDWATERVMAPHAEHTDPREHPDCVVCRTMSALGDVGLRASSSVSDVDTAAGDAGDDDESTEASTGQPDAVTLGAPVIEWIPIRDEVPEP